MLVFVLAVISVFSMVAIADEKPQWGITTKKQLEKYQNPTIENPGLETTPVSKTSGDEHPSKPTAQKHISSVNHTTTGGGGSANPKGTAIADSKQRPKLDSETRPGSKKAAPAAKNNNPSSKDVIWANQKQKTICQAYTQDLRELFIKTRHYSIQEAPCKTRDFAIAFRLVKDKCAEKCPDGFLRNSGYTDRIIRNITYLEKLGNGRCSDNKKPISKP